MEDETMDHRASAQTPDAPSEAHLLSRRTLIQGAAAAGFGAATTALLGRPAPAAGAARSARAEAWDWRVFDDGVGAAMRTFDMVGAAVAVVTGAGISHSRTFGVRDRATGAPVTPQTLFRIGSATKSMTALLVATFVDEKLLGWDQRVVKVWPEFRAPSDALTSKLRVRDLMGMATGLGEQGRIALHYDDPGALELLQLLANLPVLTPPYTTWYYNNPVFASAGYLPPLLQGVGADELEGAYARLMQERVFGPVGMATARLGDDPRPYTADYATGYAPDLVEGVAAEPWVPLGSTMPAGGVLASLTDMAAHVRMQLRRGESAGGMRVVSSRNLEECWRPHVDVPRAPTDGPSLVSGGYCMGWIDYTYT
jgi:CubicO group peptidase (beta-lactamase class C family)